MLFLTKTVFTILLLAVSSGIILKCSDKTIRKYQNRHLLNIVVKINQICSSVILIPFQIILSLFVIMFVLMIILSLIENLFVLNQLTLLLIFSFWLISMQFYMKYFWKIIEFITNGINEYLKLPKTISSFIGHIFYGKILIYIVALIFVIINNTTLDIQIIDSRIINEMKPIINSSVLIFIALDRIINGIQSWIKNNKN